MSCQQTEQRIVEDDVKQFTSVTELDIDITIIKERNEAMRKIAQDMQHLSDINLSLSELIYEQSEPLETIEQNIISTQENTKEAVEHLTNASILSNKFRGVFAKGALVGTGVTGAGAAAGIFLNPVVGGIAVVAGVGSVIFCLLQMGG